MTAPATQNTCAKSQKCAASTPRKPAASKGSVTLPNRHLICLSDTEAEGTLIIGFDAEWATTLTRLEDDDVAEPSGGRDLSSYLNDPIFDPTPQNEREVTVLSYQLACIAPNGRRWGGVIYSKAADKIAFGWDPNPDDADRCPLFKLLGSVIASGLRHGHLTTWPKKVFLVGHWTRADLSVLADFPDLKTKFDTVHKTFVTAGRPYLANFNIGKHNHKIRVVLVDTMNLTPASAGKSLDALGEMLGLPKLHVGKTKAESDYYKSHMDLLLLDDPDLFKRYAMRDSEIVAVFLDRFTDFYTDELDLALRNPPVTITALAEKYLLAFWKQAGIDPAYVNGYTVRKVKNYLQDLKRWGKQKVVREYDPGYSMNEKLATECFHGGRNESFYFGPTEAGRDRWREFDLASAYATALATLGVPDYGAARQTTDLGDFRVDQIGGALVSFAFPPDTRFPCLPIVARDGRGLIFPLRGESYATAPEIIQARRMGAELKVRYGYVVPWVEGAIKPFRVVITDLLEKRRAATVEMQKQTFKLMANGLYGKTGQGLKPKNLFNSREGIYERMPQSKISNPFIAAHVTGLVRACVSEMIAALPAHRQVLSVTTDSLVTDAKRAEIDLSGPVCRLLAATGQALGTDALLDIKYTEDQMLSWATRGIATLDGGVDEKGEMRKGKALKLAMRGMRAPKGEDPNAWHVRTMLTRLHDTKWTDNNALPFTTLYKLNADPIFVDTEHSVTFEYDHKRRLVAPKRQYAAYHDGDGFELVEHIAAHSEPWDTIEDFNADRDQFEQWHKHQRGVLRTMADWQSWRDFRAGAAASKAGVRRRRGGTLKQAVSLFIRAWVRREWGLPGYKYAHTAYKMGKAGYATNTDAFKNAARRYKLLPTPEHTIAADTEGVTDFVAEMSKLWPTFDGAKLLSKGR